MEKLAIGITGANGAGKTTLARILKQLIQEDFPDISAYRHSSGEILSDCITQYNAITQNPEDMHIRVPACLDILGFPPDDSHIETFLGCIRERFPKRIPPDRAGMQELVELIETNMQPGFLTNAVRARMLLDKAIVSIFDGVRLPSDERMLRELPVSQTIIIAVGALPEVRYERLKKRAEKESEASMTWREFQAQDSAPTEQCIDGIAVRSDVWIPNNVQGEESLAQKTKGAYRALIASELARLVIKPNS